jgi:hypothetical protein
MTWPPSSAFQSRIRPPRPKRIGSYSVSFFSVKGRPVTFVASDFLHPVCIVNIIIMGLSWKSYHEGYFAKTSHGYYVTYQKFDNETKTHRAAIEEGAAAAATLLLLFCWHSQCLGRRHVTTYLSRSVNNVRLSGMRTIEIKDVVNPQRACC